MADGSITFSTALDNSELDRQIKDAENQIERLKKTIEQKTTKRNAIKEQIDEANQAIDETKANIDRLKARLQELKDSGEAPGSGRTQVVVEELDKASQSLVKQVDAAAKLDKQYYALDDDVARYTGKLEEAQAGYRQLSSAASASMAGAETATARAATTIRSRLGDAANGARAAMSNAANTAGNAWTMVASKVTKTMRKVFVFSLIVGAIRAIKSELSGMVASNEQFHASIENLKAVSTGFIAALGNVVLPAFIGVVNVLSGILERVAGLIDFLFGSNIAGMIGQARANASANIQASNAEAMAQNSGKAASAANKQAKAAKNLAKEQKKANRELLSFDELNVLTKEDAEDVADAMEDIPDYGVEAYAPTAAPAIDWTQSFKPDAGMFQGVLDWLDMLKKRIETDVTGPFAKIREGLQLIKKGYEELVTGIQTGDWKLVWIGIGDIIIGALYVIQGAIGAFLGWLDEVTGGHFHDFFTGIALTLQGVVDIIEGVLRGDLSQVIQGIFELIDGLALTLSGAVNGVIFLLSEAWGGVYNMLSGGIDALFDHLIEKYPEYAETFETMREIAHNVLDAIDGFVRGFLENAGKGLNNWIEGIRLVISGFLDILVGLFTGDFDRVKQGAWEVISGILKFFGINIEDAQRFITEFIEKAKKFLGGLKETITGIITGVISMAAEAFAGMVENAKGAATGIIEALGGIGGGIEEGLRGAVNTVLGTIEYALNSLIHSATDTINHLIDGANTIPGVWIPYVWVPDISLPRLAGGAVIPPNREFMAVLGDQTSGNNIEAPESLIRQIVREESSNDQQLLLLTQILTAIQAGQTLECDGYTLAKVVNRRNMINGNLYGRM